MASALSRWWFGGKFLRQRLGFIVLQMREVAIIIVAFREQSQCQVLCRGAVPRRGCCCSGARGAEEKTKAWRE